MCHKKRATTQHINSKGEWPSGGMTTWGGLKRRLNNFVGAGSLLADSTFVSRENDSSKKHEQANSYW